MMDHDHYRSKLTEDQMQAAIEDLVQVKGGKVFHIRNSKNAPEMEGFPDLVIIMPDQRAVLFIELKSQRRDITVEQRRVMTLLTECDHALAAIVRPTPNLGEWSYDDLLAVLNDE